MAFTLRSAAFAQGAPIPRQHSCDGPNLSPPLDWQEPPPGTKGFALICEDPDAPSGTFVHWVLYGIPRELLKLPEGVPSKPKLQDGSTHGKNDFGRMGYGGPCPPPGKPHRYFLRLYALDAKLELNPGLSRFACLKAMEGHVLGKAEYMGTYARS